MVINMAKRDKPYAILIEEENNGIALLQDLRSDEESKYLNLVGMPTKGKSKEVRAIAVTGVCESGVVQLPVEAFWLSDFEHELRHFPNVENDDQIDQMTQAISWMKENNLGPAALRLSQADPFSSFNRPAGR